MFAQNPDFLLVIRILAWDVNPAQNVPSSALVNIQICGGKRVTHFGQHKPFPQPDFGPH